MKAKTLFAIIWLTGLLLITSCAGSGTTGPTSTPDPMLMDIYERTTWDFENLREEVNDLAAEAADTPAEDLEPILHQMQTLNGEINEYEFPLFASQTHSALLNLAWNTEQCYFGKYAKYLADISGQGLMREVDDRCDQAQVYEETLNLYLQELKEINAKD